MRDVIEYVIVGAADFQVLAERVNEKIAQGFQPYAGLQNRGYEESHYLFQPMVKFANYVLEEPDHACHCSYADETEVNCLEDKLS